jgi:hypothetical protein
MVAISLVALGLSACVQPPPRRVMTTVVPVATATAPAIYFYPSQGQSEARQERDRFECYQWAKSQTGTDPGMTPVRGPTTTIVEPQVTGAGAAVGAVTGAAIGAATSGRRGGGGAVVLGAIIGSVFGAATENANANSRAHAQAQADTTQARQLQAVASRQADAFRRAMGACMSSRGYNIG